MSVLTTEMKAEILSPLVVLALPALMVGLLVAELPMGAGAVKVEALVVAMEVVLGAAMEVALAMVLKASMLPVEVTSAARRNGSQALKRFYPAHPLVPVGIKLTSTS